MDKGRGSSTANARLKLLSAVLSGLLVAGLVREVLGHEATSSPLSAASCSQTTQPQTRPSAFSPDERAPRAERSSSAQPSADVRSAAGRSAPPLAADSPRDAEVLEVAQDLLSEVYGAELDVVDVATSGVELLEQLSRDPTRDPKERVEAAFALRSLQHAAPSEQTLAPLVEIASRTPDRQLALDVSALLDRESAAQHVEWLHTLLGSRHEQVRVQAILLLRAQPDARSRQWLQVAERDDASASVQALARYALSSR